MNGKQEKIYTYQRKTRTNRSTTNEVFMINGKGNPNNKDFSERVELYILWHMQLE